MAETVKPQLASHDHCTGCGACASGCPKGAVHMVRDKEGFLYPQITDGCVGCGHCAHVCPALKQREVRSAPAVFAVWNEDEAVRAHSTAGGVFTALAEFALECGGVVFGAALDEKLQVRHIVVKNKEDLRLLRGAKPIQSELGETYQQVQMYLEQRRFVLFCGTPCQVDGLLYAVVSFGVLPFQYAVHQRFQIRHIAGVPPAAHRGDHQTEGRGDQTGNGGVKGRQQRDGQGVGVALTQGHDAGAERDQRAHQAQHGSQLGH